MTQKRDRKGRILRKGEAQSEDGRYSYRYTDTDGKRKTIYSWKLTAADTLPPGKRDTADLRSMEQQIMRDIDDGIATSRAETTTVNDLFQLFLQLRTSLRTSTWSNYNSLYEKHISHGFGQRKVSAIKYSDVFKLYQSLHDDAGLSISTIQSINAIIWQCFKIAVKDELIRSNPAEGVMIDYSRRLKESPKERRALTPTQQSDFIAYVYKEDKYRRYGPLFTVLLGTGMRIGEALGLTWNDVDFKRNLIVVTHAICYRPGKQTGYEYRITEPKTKAGVREIPMLSGVKTALRALAKEQKKENLPAFSVGGYSDFVFRNTSGKVYTTAFIFDILQNIVYDFNADEKRNSLQTKATPSYLPKLSAHIFRHTFCTRLCENETNLKVVQSVMGHKNIRTTMNVYAEATTEQSTSSFQNLEGKFTVI